MLQKTFLPRRYTTILALALIVMSLLLAGCAGDKKSDRDGPSSRKMGAKDINDAEEILQSLFWKMLIAEVDKERGKIYQMLSVTTIRFDKDAHKISRLQGQLGMLEMFKKMPDKVLDEIKKKTG